MKKIISYFSISFLVMGLVCNAQNGKQNQSFKDAVIALAKQKKDKINFDKYKQFFKKFYDSIDKKQWINTFIIMAKKGEVYLEENGDLRKEAEKAFERVRTSLDNFSESDRKAFIENFPSFIVLPLIMQEEFLKQLYEWLKQQ